MIFWFCFLILLKPQVLGNYLVVQWLGFQASTAAGTVGHDSWSGEKNPQGTAKNKTKQNTQKKTNEQYRKAPRALKMHKDIPPRADSD